MFSKIDKIKLDNYFNELAKIYKGNIVIKKVRQIIFRYH